MATIKVIDSGFSTAVIDWGRRGFQSSGVPVSGPMDQISFKLANSILNNFEGAACLECTLLGPTLQFDAPTVVCLTGADMEISLNGEAEQSYKPILIQAGDELKLGKCTDGVRSYLAIKHGFHSPEVLGSKSFFYPVTEQSFLTQGNTLEYSADDRTKHQMYVRIKTPNHWKKDHLWVRKGPEWTLVEDQIDRLIDKPLIIGPNNRMGYRIESQLEHEPTGMYSSAVIMGTVQLTPSGQLLVAAADCQVTGGYPRVLLLDQIGMSMLSQKRTGQTIYFNWKKA